MGAGIGREHHARRTRVLEAEVYRLNQERRRLTEKLIKAEHERLLEEQESDFLRGALGETQPNLRKKMPGR